MIIYLQPLEKNENQANQYSAELLSKFGIKNTAFAKDGPNKNSFSMTLENENDLEKALDYLLAQKHVVRIQSNNQIYTLSNRYNRVVSSPLHSTSNDDLKRRKEEHRRKLEQAKREAVKRRTRDRHEL